MQRWQPGIKWYSLKGTGDFGWQRIDSARDGAVGHRQQRNALCGKRVKVWEESKVA